MMKRREELNLFLASLDDAYQHSKISKNTYDYLKKKNTAILKRLETKIEKTKSERLKGKISESVYRRVLNDINKLLEKKLSRLTFSERIEDLGDKIERMESVLKKMPYLKARITRLRNELEEYQDVLSAVKTHENLLKNELDGIRKSLTRARKQLKQESIESDTSDEKIKRNMEKIIGDFDKKIDILSRKIGKVWSSLNKKIEEVAVTDDVQISENMKRFRKQIKDIKSDLTRYVKEEDIENMLLRPIIRISPEKAKRKDKANRMPQKKGMSYINDLPNLVGKRITIKCSLEPFRVVEERGMRFYWYMIRDRTGEGIMTSYESIPAKKAKISGVVKVTKTGSLYVLFKKKL